VAALVCGVVVPILLQRLHTMLQRPDNGAPAGLEGIFGIISTMSPNNNLDTLGGS